MIFACLSKLSLNKQVVHRAKDNVNLQIASLPLFSLNIVEIAGQNFVTNQVINSNIKRIFNWKSRDSATKSLIQQTTNFYSEWLYLPWILFTCWCTGGVKKEKKRYWKIELGFSMPDTLTGRSLACTQSIFKPFLFPEMIRKRNSGELCIWEQAPACKASTLF